MSGLDETHALKTSQYTRGRFLLGLFLGLNHDFRIQWRFVRVADAGKVFHFASDGFLIHAFDVTLDTKLQRGIDKNFDKVLDLRPNFVAHGTIGRDCSRDRDSTMLGNQAADKSDASDVFVAVFFAETETLG